MRKIIIALLLLASVLTGYSQSEGNLKTQFYFRFGYSNPTWKCRGADGKSDWRVFAGPDVKKIGGLFEFGNIYMLNSIKIAPGLRIGINVDYLSLSYNRFSDMETFNYVDNIHFFSIGSKVGPSISYSPVKHLVFDTYFKINPVWATASVLTHTNDYDDDLYMGFVGMKYCVGLNVRYSVLMMGFEFNPGSIKYRKYDTENNELTDTSWGNMHDYSAKKTPVPAMNFTLGLSF